MKTFAQLKRDIKEGSLIKTILNNIKPEKNGEIRKVGKVQSNAIAFEIPKEQQKTNIWGEVQILSWLWWGKASQYEYQDNIFKVFDNNKNLCFVYEIMEE